MKFLLLARPAMNPPRPKPVQGKDRALEAREWLKEKKESGTIDCVHSLVPEGVVAIVNVDSYEKAFALLTAYPMYSHFYWEAIPLTDIDALLTRLADHYNTQIEIRR